VSFLFKLRYADPTELQQVLSQYLSPPQPYTSFLALPKSGSLLVTESTAVIRKLVTIIDQVDIPPAEVVSEFIKLERADASKVVDLLKEIFERNPNAGGPQPVGGVRGVRMQPPGPPQPVENDLAGLMALTEESVVVGKIKLTADVRTNRIHVVTRPINMPFVRKLIGEFDANVEFAKPVTRPLKYVSASEVLPVLVQALTEPGEEGAGATGTPGAGGPNQQQQQQQQQQRRNQPNTNNQYTGAGSNTGESGLNVSEELSTTPVDTTPQAVTVGNAKIVADQRANAIIVLGNREVVVKVQKILDEMDVKAPQVALSTVIGELTLDNDEEFGVDYFAKYHNRLVGTSNNNSRTTLPIPLPTAAGSPSSISGVIDPANLINFSQIIRNLGGATNIYVAAGNSFASLVHLLESTGRFKVINRPVVFTSNNKKAIIASGSEIPVPVSSLTNVANSNVVNGTAAVASNIEYKKIALQLEVVPLINSEREVTLDILQKLDSQSGSTLVDGNLIPTIDTRYVRTNVSAASGSTIILGGLITETNRKDASGIPVLGRIPYLGALFRNTTIHKERKELIILMCPEVTMTKLDLYRLRQQKEQKTHLGPDIEDLCPDCPPPAGEEKQLPPPDLPMDTKTMRGE
jgi:general secretion pathway protein D